MNLFRQFVLVFLALAAAFSACAEEQRNLGIVPKSDATNEARIALVIGNSRYKNGPALRNPGNDAQAMAARLKTLGFDVILRTDSTQKDMNRAITRFGEKLSRGGVGLFYYAGHGLQVRGKNFLIPVDAEIEGEPAVRSESVDIDLVLEQLAATRIGVVILDACRNNPFEHRFRSGSGNGLAQVDAPKGVLIAYATAPGKVAADGTGQHGLYTSELLHALDQPGRRIEDVFKQVRIKVSGATNDQQIPWESSSLTGDFYFSSPALGEMSAGTAGNIAPGGETPPALVELEMWRSVKDSDNASDYEEYLRHYPSGEFADLAHARIKRLSPPPSLESELAGKWDFGRARGGLFAPAGHLCDLELLPAKGAYGNVIRSCHSNESFWRVRGDTLEVLGSDGQVTTIFTRVAPDRWEGAYIGPGSSLISGVIHYLKRKTP